MTTPTIWDLQAFYKGGHSERFAGLPLAESIELFARKIREDNVVALRARRRNSETEPVPASVARQRALDPKGT